MRRRCPIVEAKAANEVKTKTRSAEEQLRARAEQRLGDDGNINWEEVIDGAEE